MSADIVGLGETLGLITVEGFGRPRVGSRAQLGFGGAETNTLIGAARLGIHGAWLGAVGDDAMGRLILNGLRAETIDVSAVVQNREAPTASMIKYARTAGSAQVDYLRTGSAFAQLQGDEFSAERVQDARVLHTSGLTAALGDGPLAACRGAISAAQDSGTLVSLDINHRHKIWRAREPRTVLRGLIAKTDVLFASLDEARLVLEPCDVPSDPIRTGRQLAAMGPKWVIIKLGEKGATAVVDGEIYHAEARAVNVHDRVGAGDALAAGVLTGMLRELSVQQSLELGVDLGTYAVTVDGDHDGAPGWEELAHFRSADEEVRR